MFSTVQAVLLKSMDMAEPERLVVMWPLLADTPGEFTYTLSIRRRTSILNTSWSGHLVRRAQ